MDGTIRTMGTKGGTMKNNGNNVWNNRTIGGTMENNEWNNGNKGWNNEEQREQWVEQQVEHCRTMDGTIRTKPENTLKTYMKTY